MAIRSLLSSKTEAVNYTKRHFIGLSFHLRVSSLRYQVVAIAAHGQLCQGHAAHARSKLGLIAHAQDTSGISARQSAGAKTRASLPWQNKECKLEVFISILSPDPGNDLKNATTFVLGTIEGLYLAEPINISGTKYRFRRHFCHSVVKPADSALRTKAETQNENIILA